jgi:hypothetical protein
MVKVHSRTRRDIPPIYTDASFTRLHVLQPGWLPFLSGESVTDTYERNCESETSFMCGVVVSMFQSPRAAPFFYPTIGDRD